MEEKYNKKQMSRGIFFKKVSLKMSQNSQENTCVRPSNFKFISNETPKQVFPCKFCKIFKNTFFTENLRW